MQKPKPFFPCFLLVLLLAGLFACSLRAQKGGGVDPASIDQGRDEFEFSDLHEGTKQGRETAGPPAVDEEPEIGIGTAESIRASGGKITLPDPFIEKSIRASLVLTRRPAVAGVALRVEQGSVLVKGKVESFEQRRLVERIVRTTPGVKAVAVRVAVSPPPARATFAADRRTFGQIVSDAEAQKTVRNRLSASRHVAASRIRVEVYDGVALMTGIARSAKEKEIAGEIALFSDGIRSVVNNLIVAMESP